MTPEEQEEYRQFKNEIHVLVKRVKYLEEHGVAGLRDSIAITALGTLASTRPCEMAEVAYAIADSMLEERKKSVI